MRDRLSDMGRWIFLFFSGISLTLAIALAALWVRCIWITDYIGHQDEIAGPRQRIKGIVSFRGSCWLGILTHPLPADAAIRATIQRQGFYWNTDSADVSSSFGPPGLLKFQAIISRDVDDEWAVIFPHWFGCLVLLALPTYAVICARRQRLRNRAGHCSSCGYDLRATPERCPECGTVTTS